MYTEEKNMAKRFLKLYANEQVVIDTLKDIKDNDYIHSERWSLVFDMFNENFPDWQKTTTGLVYLVEDGELEEVLNALKDNANITQEDAKTTKNKRVRMTVEFAVNEEILKETGVSFDDVVNGIRFNKHDAIDGFEITTNVPGCDCTSDFFLCGGDIVSIEEKKTLSHNRLEKINAYKDNEEFLKASAEQKLQDEADGLVAKIRELKPRVDELITTANACLENGIELNAYGNSFYRDLDKYEKGTFVTNSISHRIGFVRPRGLRGNSVHHFAEMGINNGGACGCYDFRTDGERVYFVHEDNKTDIKGPSHKTSNLKSFLDKFDEFETAFYDYVDKIIDKQQKTVDSVIADASGRSEETGEAGKGVSKDTIVLG